MVDTFYYMNVPVAKDIKWQVNRQMKVEKLWQYYKLERKDNQPI